MATEIFRKVALERLSSPDQLDRLITLTSPLGWTSLVAIIVLLSAVVAWSVIGRVPTRVEGAGIFIARGGQVFDAMAPEAGTLAWVAPIGTKVAKGEVVARFDDTQARQDLLHAQNVLHEQEQDLAQLTARLDRDIEARQRVDAQQRQNLEDIIASAERRRGFYATEIEREEPVSKKGFITPRYIQQTREQMEAAEQEGRRARNDLLRIDAEELDMKGHRDQDVYHQEEAVNSARRALDEVKIRVARSEKVVSPIDGHITEVKAGVGAVVLKGRPIVSIETAGHGLELVLYVAPDQGKKVAPGMPVRVEPVTFKKEEFGTLQGSVLAISEFPVSAEGMTAVLQNPQLVTRFSAHGAPYAARVALATDPATPSGYAWSAGKGPNVKLSSGTTAAAEVTVREQAPITLVLPLLRSWTGIAR
jgi:HlyD family secretion protein